MSSILVTVEDAALAALTAAVAGIEGAVITTVVPEVEAGLIAFLQTAGSDIASAFGGFLQSLSNVFSPPAPPATPVV